MRNQHDTHTRGTTPRRTPMWARWAATIATIATLMGGMTTAGTAIADDPATPDTTQSQTTGTDTGTQSGGGFTINPDGTTTPDPNPNTTGGTQDGTGTGGTDANTGNTTTPAPTDTTNDGNTNTGTGTDTDTDKTDADKATLTIKSDPAGQLGDTLFTMWRIGMYGASPDGEFTAKELPVTATDKDMDGIVRPIADPDGKAPGTDPVAALWARWADPDNTDDPPTQAMVDAIGDALARSGRKPDAEARGEVATKLDAGWYLIRDDKGTSRLMGTLTADTANPTDVRLGTLTITTGTNGGDTDGAADGKAREQSAMDAAQAANETAADTDAQAGTLTAPRQEASGVTSSDLVSDDGTPSTLSVDDLTGKAGKDDTPSSSPSTRQLADDPTLDIAITTPNDAAKELAAQPQRINVDATGWTTLMGHEFTLHRIGLYNMDKPTGTFTTRMMNPIPADGKAQSAVSAALGGDPMADGNATADLWARWTGASDAPLTQDMVNKVGDALKDTTPEATISGAGEAQVPTGWYVARDSSDGTSRLVGTTVDGRQPSDTPMGGLTVEGLGAGSLFGTAGQASKVRAIEPQADTATQDADAQEPQDTAKTDDTANTGTDADDTGDTGKQQPATPADTDTATTATDAKATPKHGDGNADVDLVPQRGTKLDGLTVELRPVGLTQPDGTLKAADPATEEAARKAGGQGGNPVDDLFARIESHNADTATTGTILHGAAKPTATRTGRGVITVPEGWYIAGIAGRDGHWMVYAGTLDHEEAGPIPANTVALVGDPDPADADPDATGTTASGSQSLWDKAKAGVMSLFGIQPRGSGPNDTVTWSPDPGQDGPTSANYNFTWHTDAHGDLPVFCVEPGIWQANSGAHYDVEEITDPVMRALLYYGEGGPNNAFIWPEGTWGGYGIPRDVNDAQRRWTTHIAVSLYEQGMAPDTYDGHWSGISKDWINKLPGIWGLWNLAHDHPLSNDNGYVAYRLVVSGEPRHTHQALVGGTMTPAHLDMRTDIAKGDVEKFRTSPIHDRLTVTVNSPGTPYGHMKAGWPAHERVNVCAKLWFKNYGDMTKYVASNGNNWKCAVYDPGDDLWPGQSRTIDLPDFTPSDIGGDKWNGRWEEGHYYFDVRIDTHIDGKRSTAVFDFSDNNLPGGGGGSGFQERSGRDDPAEQMSLRDTNLTFTTHRHDPSNGDDHHDDDYWWLNNTHQLSARGDLNGQPDRTIEARSAENTVRDDIVFTVTGGTWRQADWVLVCTTLHYDSNDPTPESGHTTASATKCRESGNPHDIGQGGTHTVTSKPFRADDLTRPDGSKLDKWWSGHYWFDTTVDSFYHFEGGTAAPGWRDGMDSRGRGNIRFPDNNWLTYRTVGGLNTTVEEFWLSRYYTAASGATTSGNGPVHDNVSAYDDHAADRIAAPWGVSVRTFLYVDSDGIKNNDDGGRDDNGAGSVQYELAAFTDADGHRTDKADPQWVKDHLGIKWDAPGNKGATVQSPGILPKDLRYRDGTLPRCTATDSGVYAPDGTARCVLSKWPSNTRDATAASYTFETKIAEDSHRGGWYYHNQNHKDPSESWKRMDWGVATTARTGDAAIGNANPVSDDIRLYPNVDASIHDVQVLAPHVTLNYATDDYGGTKGRAKADKTTGNVTWTAGMDKLHTDESGRYVLLTELGGADKLGGFTPSDLWPGATGWKDGYYWFDLTGKGRLITDCTGSADPKCEVRTIDLADALTLQGASDMAERFRISQPRLEGRTEQVANGKSAANGNPAIDKLTLTAPSGSDLDPSKATAKGVTFTLHYSPTGYGDANDGKDGNPPSKQASKSADGNGATITSPEFIPKDLWDGAARWAEGFYWFDVDAPDGAITIDGVPMAGLSLAGSSDEKERFRITAPQPVSVQLEAEKHWDKGTSPKSVRDFQAELFTGDSTDPKDLQETVRFAATNDDGTEGKATFKAKQYTVKNLGDANDLTKTFTIRERPADDPKDTQGIEYDATIHKATVHVYLNDKGELKADVTYDDGKKDAPTFTNTYTPKPTSFPLEAMKKLKDDNGNALTVKAGQFTFDLKDKDGKTIQSKTTTDGGKVTFDPINVTGKDMGGKATLDLDYTIVEAKGNDPYMEYDTTPHTVHVQVRDDGRGNLTVTAITYDDDNTGQKPTITNTRHSKVMLPITGGMDPLMLAGIGMAVVLLAGGAVLLVRRRKHTARHA